MKQNLAWARDLFKVMVLTKCIYDEMSFFIGIFSSTALSKDNALSIFLSGFYDGIRTARIKHVLDAKDAQDIERGIEAELDAIRQQGAELDAVGQGGSRMIAQLLL